MSAPRALRGFLSAGCVVACATSFVGCADVPQELPAQVDADPSARVFRKLPVRDGDRPTVAIYEFRSAVDEISPRGSTDLFTTALVRSGQFRVVERARLNTGVGREKQLNGAGLTKGTVAQTQLTGAQYIFEGAITEANVGQTQRNLGVSIAGMDAGGGVGRDVIGVDVRVVDADSGEVVDVVTVRKPIASDSASVSGIGNVVSTAMARRGKNTSFVPDVQYQQQRQASVDVALRAAIDQAVFTLAGRFGR